MRVMITGADGFIGSHLTELILSAGHQVLAFCLYNSTGSWGWLDTLPPSIRSEVQVVLGDIRDPLCVREAMRGCDQVFHLAALIAIPYSYVARLVTSIQYPWHAEYCSGCSWRISCRHTSTSETYGTAQRFRSQPLGSVPYAASKVVPTRLL